MVEYKDIPDYPGYRVGSDGSVWSCRYGCQQGSRRRNTWRQLRPRYSTSKRTSLPVKGRYRFVTLATDAGENKNLLVHVLVLTAFVSPRPDGMEGCHKDGDPANNRLENLRWDTRKANLEDMLAHGTRRRGTERPSAKLTEDDVRSIRRLREEGWLYRKICERFGISQRTALAIVNRQKWKHVS